MKGMSKDDDIDRDVNVNLRWNRLGLVSMPIDSCSSVDRERSSYTVDDGCRVVRCEICIGSIEHVCFWFDVWLWFSSWDVLLVGRCWFLIQQAKSVVSYPNVHERTDHRYLHGGIDHHLYRQAKRTGQRSPCRSRHWINRRVSTMRRTKMRWHYLTISTVHSSRTNSSSARGRGWLATIITTLHSDVSSAADSEPVRKLDEIKKKRKYLTSSSFEISEQWDAEEHEQNVLTQVKRWMS